MFLPLLLTAALAMASPSASPPPAATPPPSGAAIPTTPTPTPGGTSIDSILQGLSGTGQETDTEDESGRTAPPPGPTPYDQLDAKAYDQALRAAAEAARTRTGPLDGGWTLAGQDGRDLYRFQFADRGQGLALAEGAWRDLDGGPRLEGSGFISQVGYDGDKLMLRFYETGPDDLVVVTLKPSPGAPWSGQIWRKGAVAPVQFKRD